MTNAIFQITANIFRNNDQIVSCPFVGDRFMYDKIHVKTCAPPVGYFFPHNASKEAIRIEELLTVFEIKFVRQVQFVHVNALTSHSLFLSFENFRQDVPPGRNNKTQSANWPATTSSSYYYKNHSLLPRLLLYISQLIYCGIETESFKELEFRF